MVEKITEPSKNKSPMTSSKTFSDVDSCSSNILIYNREDITDHLPIDSQRIQQFGGFTLIGNVSTIVFSKTTLSQLDSEELGVLENVLRTERTLFVVRFGEVSKDEEILSGIAKCWATSSVVSDEENTVYFCSKVGLRIPKPEFSESSRTSRPPAPFHFRWAPSRFRWKRVFRQSPRHHFSSVLLPRSTELIRRR